MPTADRDRMKEQSIIDIQNKFDEEIKKHYAEYDLVTVQDYLESLDKPFYENIYKVKDYIDEDRYQRIESVDSLFNRYFATLSSQVKLKKLLNGDKKVIVLKSLRADLIERLESHFKDEELIFIRLGTRERNYERTHIFLEQLGFTFGEEYIKENSVKTVKRKTKNMKSALDSKPCVIFSPQNSNYHVKLLGYQGWRNRYSTTIGEINKNADPDRMIKALPNMFGDLNNHLTSSYHIVLIKDRKGLHEDIENYSVILDRCKKKSYYTSDGGKKSFSDIDYYDYACVVDNEQAKTLSDILSKCDSEQSYKFIFVETEKEAFALHCESKIGTIDRGYNALQNLIPNNKIDEHDGMSYFESLIFHSNVLDRLPDGLKKVYKMCLTSNSYEDISSELLKYGEK